MSPLLEIRNLKKYFPLRKTVFSRFKSSGGEVVRAVDGVSFSLTEGEALAIIGESGSGKTTLAKTIVGLYRPTEGEIIYKGEKIGGADGAAMKKLRQEAQLIFQDALAALNPRMSVRACLEEPLILRGIKSKRERERRISEALARVRLQSHFASRYPAELSGGQRQRVCLARALLWEPRLLIADEPVAGLDLSVKAQVLNLLLALQKELQLTYLLISHDIPAAVHLCDRIAVMCQGRLVEIIPAERIYQEAVNPYTRALISAAEGRFPLFLKNQAAL